MEILMQGYFGPKGRLNIKNRFSRFLTLLVKLNACMGIEYTAVSLIL
jgi:hypothetical protein